jgi:putative endonuclease
VASAAACSKEVGVFKKSTGQAAADGQTDAAAPGRGEHTKALGDAAEDRALAWLQQQGLELVQRNYRVARGPQARGGCECWR